MVENIGRKIQSINVHSPRRVNVVAIGELAFDNIITSSGSRINIAGAVYNLAIGASTVAEPKTVGIVARVGTDFQEGFNALHRRNIDTQGVAIILGKTVTFTITIHDDDTREIQADWGVGGIVDTSIFPDTYRSAKYLHLATNPPDKHLQWLSYLRQASTLATISADAADFWMQSENAVEQTVKVLQSVDLVFINEVELSMIKSHYPNILFINPVVLKKGEAGATYTDLKEGIEVTIPAPQVKVIDTTGAGDTLAGVFLTCRAQGLSIEESLQKGIFIASKSVTQNGIEHIM